MFRASFSRNVLYENNLRRLVTKFGERSGPGQMQMYVNYFDRYVKLEHEAPTVGIILCHRKSDAVVELTLPENSNIHASEYQLYLPSKEELKKQLAEVQLAWKRKRKAEG